MDLTVPLAFKLTAESAEKLEMRVRHACRDLFYEQKLLGAIINDIDDLLQLSAEIDVEGGDADDYDGDAAMPSGLWSPDDSYGTQTPGGVNYGGDHS